MQRPYLKRWPLPSDSLGMIDAVPRGYPLRPGLLDLFESLGDNCELGFVQRFHGSEPSSLFRWATAPLHGVIAGLEDGWRDLYAFDSLLPWAYDMAWDDKYQCAFHGNIACEIDDTGQLNFSLGDAARHKVWTTERLKVVHLRDKTLKCLRSGEKIFVAKANAGLTLDACHRLKAALDRYGPNRILCVTPRETIAYEGVMLVSPGLKVATISQLASYSRVELSAYGEWTNILQKAKDTPWD